MEIISNFLSEEMLTLVKSYFNDDYSPKIKDETKLRDMNLTESGWKLLTLSNNHHIEYSNVIKNEETLKKYIISKLPDTFDIPKLTENISNIWFRVLLHGGRMTFHKDNYIENKKLIALTIYLNEEWNVDWGGLYLYEIDGEKKFYVPKFNDAVMTKNNLSHGLSTIDNTAKYPRATLNVFFAEKKHDMCPIPAAKVITEEIVVNNQVTQIPKENKKLKIEWMNRG